MSAAWGPPAEDVPEDPRVAEVEWWAGCDDPGGSDASAETYEAQLWGAP